MWQSLVLSVTEAALSAEQLAAGLIVGDPMFQVFWQLRGLHPPFAQVLYYSIRRGAQHVLSETQQGAHETIAKADKTRLQVEGAVVPALQSRVYLERLKQAQRAT